jgi:uncharacterized delta-60 repeat protein
LTPRPLRAGRLAGGSLLVCLACGLALGGAARAAGNRVAVAAGRVVFPVDGGAIAANAAGGKATKVVALPDGGAVLVGGGDPGHTGFYAAELTPVGSLAPGFGTGGVAHVEVDAPPPISPLALLRQPDGKLVVVVSGGASTASVFGQMLVVRLDADGGLDPTFGSDGIVALPLAPACQECTPAALAPDGDIFVTGEGGQLSAALGGDPTAPQTWDVAAVSPSGALDQSFGAGGLETVAATDAGGYAVTVLPTGEILTLGVASLSNPAASVAMLALLGPHGGADRDFDGGTPAALPADSGASAMLAEPDGSIVVGGRSALYGYTPLGAPDASFGDDGVASVGPLPFPLELLPAAGGDVLAVGPLDRSPGTLGAVRVTATGTVDESFGGPTGAFYTPRFGGGDASPASGPGRGPAPRLGQDSFVAGGLVARPDGSYLAVGGVDVVAPAGERRGDGRSVFDFAAAALTPGFTGASGFGGRARHLALKLTIPAQTAAADSRHGISVGLDASAPGLALVTIRAGGSVIARSLLPILAAGPQTLPVALTSRGAGLLRDAAGVRVTASASGRDLLGALAHAAATGTLT